MRIREHGNAVRVSRRNSGAAGPVMTRGPRSSKRHQPGCRRSQRYLSCRHLLSRAVSDNISQTGYPRGGISGPEAPRQKRESTQYPVLSTGRYDQSMAAPRPLWLKAVDWITTIPMLIAFGTTLVLGDIAARIARLFGMRPMEVAIGAAQRVLIWTFRISGVRLTIDRHPGVLPGKGYIFLSNHQSLFDVPIFGGTEIRRQERTHKLDPPDLVQPQTRRQRTDRPGQSH